MTQWNEWRGGASCVCRRRSLDFGNERERREWRGKCHLTNKRVVNFSTHRAPPPPHEEGKKFEQIFFVLSLWLPVLNGENGLREFPPVAQSSEHVVVIFTAAATFKLLLFPTWREQQNGKTEKQSERIFTHLLLASERGSKQLEIYFWRKTFSLLSARLSQREVESCKKKKRSRTGSEKMESTLRAIVAAASTWIAGKKIVIEWKICEMEISCLNRIMCVVVALPVCWLESTKREAIT